MKLSKVAQKIVKDNIYLSLATSNHDACWIAPLYYVHDAHYNFYFVSDRNSVHGRHIARNPYVAATIFNTQEKPEKVNGVQLDGLCQILPLIELPRAIKLIYSRKESALLQDRFLDYRDPHSYFSLTNFRVYRITPLHCYVLDPRVSTEDKRVEVRL